MRMQKKAGLLYLTAVSATIGIGVLLIAVLPKASQPLAGIASLIVGLLFGIAQFVSLTCPHCNALAIRKPNGGWTPFIGDECRYCHRAY